MRFSTTSALLALPLLGAAAEDGGVFGQYRAQFQNFLGSFGAALPKAATSEEPAPAGATPASRSRGGTATTGVRPLHNLSLNNWKSTLYEPVKEGATTPEEWYVLVTGRNKTCFGHCGIVDEAFSKAAPKLGSIPKGPHLAVLNCEDESILCSSWSASAGYLYIFEVLPQPAKTDIYYKRLNLTTSTAETFTSLYESKSKEGLKLFEGHFHPLDGTLAVNGLAVPVAYILYLFGLVPNWVVMIGVSFLSRTMMGRRTPGGPPRAGGPAPPAAAAQ